MREFAISLGPAIISSGNCNGVFSEKASSVLLKTFYFVATNHDIFCNILMRALNTKEDQYGRRSDC